MAITRETARICRISDILQGNYVTQEGWQPNYVKTSLGNISRANIMGTVVSVEDTKSFFFDDGTGRMLVRSFEKEHPTRPGDTILLIGRPRIYNNELFLAPEIVKTITEPLWVDVRKEHLSKLPQTQIQEKGETTTTTQPPDTTETLLATIQALDTGDGVMIDTIATNPETEKRMNKLLEEGRIYQNKPGHIKVL